VGERPDDDTLASLLADVDAHGDGRLGLDCFLRAADRLLGEAPARIVLVVGGPGSGKGELCRRLATTCGAVHLRSVVVLFFGFGSNLFVLSRFYFGDVLPPSPLSCSNVIHHTLRGKRNSPKKRLVPLLDGFPRSLENARDFVELCGPPELALHLNCDDTVMIERILSRAANGGGGGGGDDSGDANDAGAAAAAAAAARSDDNVHTAIQRLKNYHKHHNPTMSWLKEIRVPIVELDCSGTKEDVWGQLTAIGRLMRPAVKLPVHQQQQRPTTSDDEIVVVRERTQQPPMQEVVYGGVLRNDAEEDMRWFA